MAQSASQIEVFATVMNSVFVPKKIDFMRPAMHPISLEIEHHKDDKTIQKVIFDVKNGKMIEQPGITKNRKTKTNNVFYGVGHA